MIHSRNYDPTSANRDEITPQQKRTLRLGSAAAVLAVSAGIWAATHSPKPAGTTSEKPVPQAALARDPQIPYTYRAGEGPDDAIANVEPGVLTGDQAVKSAVEQFVAKQGDIYGQTVQVPIASAQEQAAHKR
ncbi:MAG TPA: hypothetical protein VLG27_04520 [Candidatus Saccharimonadia bacterium]|nr:hypothetical protein [Candidatus Saccharimonadia bacterium]